MRTLPSIRSISNYVAELVGDWCWPIDEHQQWQLQMRVANLGKKCEGPLWRINTKEGCSLGIVRADSLCRWLDMEQLMELDPHIGIQAASIALHRDRLAQFLGITHSAAIDIDHIDHTEESSELPLFMDVQIIVPEDEIQKKLNKKTLRLHVSIEVLMQHLCTQTIQTAKTSIHMAPYILSQVHPDVILEVGHITLPSRRLTDLRPSCLILLGGDYVDKGVLHAKVGFLIIDILEQKEENAWMVQAIHQPQPSQTEHEESHLSVTQTSEQREMNIDDIPVNIKVQLVHANMKLSELINIQPGALIDIGTTQDATVNLLCNEVRIAQGYLVELDGRLAVEISSIF